MSRVHATDPVEKSLSAVVPAIEAKDLSKRYWSGWLNRSAGTLALSDVSFSVNEGEVVGLLGPNGAGKTTLLKIIATMLRSTAGHVRLHGHDVATEPVKARGMLGLVTSDERSFYWRLSGRENLRFFAALYGVPSHEATARVARLLIALGLADAADRQFHGYSSGMKQKMAIARGLLAQPRIILYDEPTRALDPVSAQNIRRWISENRVASPATTHLIATNQLHEAELLCDRVLIINRGVLIAYDTVAKLRERWRRAHRVHRIVYSGPVFGITLPSRPDAGLLDVAFEGREGDHVRLRVLTVEGSDGLSLALSTILRAGGRVTSCESDVMAFDEVFFSIIGADSASNAARVPA